MMLQHEIFDLKTREREREGEENYMRRESFEEKMKPNKKPERKTRRAEARPTEFRQRSLQHRAN